MAKQQHDQDEPLVIGDATALLFAGTRRSFLRKLMAGGTVLMMPSFFTACDDDDDNDNPLGPTPDPVTGLTLDLRSDVGIFRLTHVHEQVEAAFYTAVVASSNFPSMFSAEERELLVDLRNVEIIHREFIGAVLGAQAVPDLRGSINQATLNTILSSRANILTTAKMLEHTGLAALNGSGKYITDARNLLVSGKLASVEARHAAALRDVMPPSGVSANTAFAGDDIIDANGRDVKAEPQTALQRDLSSGLVLAGTFASTPITAGPTATQGVPTPDALPTTL